MRINTKGENGRANGYVILGWNELEKPDERPAQVYHTAIAPHSRKGPHLHQVRCGRFQCIVGNVKIVTRSLDGKYSVFYSGEAHGYEIVRVAPGTAAALYNDGDHDAIVMNMPSPAWSPDEQDEWPVENWIL